MKKGLRVVATAVLVCFLTTQSVGAAPGAGIEMAGSRELPAYLSIDVPVDLGTVDALYEAPAGANPQFVLHIQNAHANYQAQMKIKQLLQYMNKKYGFKTIFVEGASEKLDADYLRLFPDQERNLKLCDELAKQGELTGVELFLMEQETKMSNAVEALGIEEADLYKANYNALKKVFGAVTDVNRFFKGFDAKLDRVASKTFTPETRGLIADWKRFEQGRRDFMPFVKALAKKSKKIMNVDLESLFAQVGWPQISRLLVIQQMEKDMNKTKGVEEQFTLLKDLRTKDVSKELLATLENFTEGSIAVGKSTHEVSPREVLERLASEAGPKGFKFSDYPAFSLYAGYVTLRSELDPKVLSEEIEYLFTQMLDTLAKEPQQKTLLSLYRDGELLRKLLHLELNRAQWRQAVEAKERIAIPSLVSRLKNAVIASGDAVVRKDQQVMPKAFSGMMDELFTAGLEFYDYAHKREAVFYKEMQTAMAERKITKAILITGGFHTDGMSDLFRENAISYGIVTPRLSEKSDEKFYRATMLQDRKHLFSVSYLEMASKLMSDGVLAAQGIRLEEVYAVILNAMMKAGTTDIDEVATFNRSELAKSKHISLVRETDARGRPIKDRYRIVTKAMGEISPAGVVRTPTTVPPRFDASRLDKNQIVNILLLRGPDGKELAPNTKVEARVVSRRDDGVIFQIVEPVGADTRLNGARTLIRNDELIERVFPRGRARDTNVQWLSALFGTATALGGAVLTVPALVATWPLFFTVIGVWAVLGFIGYRVFPRLISRILDFVYHLTYRKEIGTRKQVQSDSMVFEVGTHFDARPPLATMSSEDLRVVVNRVREDLRRAVEKGNVSHLHVAWDEDLKQMEIREATLNSKNVLRATNIATAILYTDNNNEVNFVFRHYWGGQTIPQVLNIPAYADLAGFKSLDELLKKFSILNPNTLPLEVREALFRPRAKVNYQQILVQPPVTRSETRKSDLAVSEEEDKLGNKRIVIQQNKTQIFSLNPKEGQPAAEKLARFLNGTLAFDYARRTGFFVAKNGEMTQGAKTYQLDVKGLQDIVSEVQRSETRSTIVETQKFAKEVWALLTPEAQKRVMQTKFIVSFRDLAHLFGQIVVPADPKLLTTQKVAMMLEVLVALKAGELNWNKFRQLAENIMANEIMAVSDKVGGTVITMTDLPSDAEWDSVALMLGMNPRVLVRFVVINDQLSRAQKDVASQRVPVIREMRDYRENRIGDRISIDFAQSIKAVETVRHAASEVFRQLRKLDPELDGGKYMSILFQDMPQLLGQEFIGTQVDSRKGDKKLAPVRNLIAVKAAQLNVSVQNISAMMLLNKQVGDDVLQFIRRQIARGYFGIDENKLAGLAKLWSDMLTRKATSVAA